MHVFDISGRLPKRLGFVPCPGSQNDVAALGKNLLGIAYHSSECAGPPSAGVRLLDVRNPKRPKYLDSIELPRGRTRSRSTPGGG